MEKDYILTRYDPKLLGFEIAGNARIYRIKNLQKEVTDGLSDEDYFKAQVELLKDNSPTDLNYPGVGLLWRDNFLTCGSVDPEFPWTLNLVNYNLSKEAETTELATSTSICNMEFKILCYESDILKSVINDVIPVDAKKIGMPHRKILDKEWKIILKTYLKQEPFVLADKNEDID